MYVNNRFLFLGLDYMKTSVDASEGKLSGHEKGTPGYTRDAIYLLARRLARSIQAQRSTLTQT
jgi:hypothetical protein